MSVAEVGAPGALVVASLMLFWVGMLGLLWRRSLVGMLVGLLFASLVAVSAALATRLAGRGAGVCTAIAVASTPLLLALSLDGVSEIPFALAVTTVFLLCTTPERPGEKRPDGLALAGDDPH